MQVTMTPAILAELKQAVSDVDAMMVEEQVHNDRERTAQKGWHGDEQRIKRYDARRKLHIAHRTRLQSIYIAITNEDPWVNLIY